MVRVLIRDADDDSPRAAGADEVGVALDRLANDPGYFFVLERDDAFIQATRPGRPARVYLDAFQVEHRLRLDDRQRVAFTDDHDAMSRTIIAFVDERNEEWTQGLDWHVLDLEPADDEPVPTRRLLTNFCAELSSDPSLTGFRFLRSRRELTRTRDDLTHTIAFSATKAGPHVSVTLRVIVTSDRLRDWQINHGEQPGHSNGRVALTYVGYLSPDADHAYPAIDIGRSRQVATWVVAHYLRTRVVPFLDTFNRARDFTPKLPDAQFRLLFPTDIVQLLLLDNDTDGLLAYLQRWHTTTPASYQRFTHRLRALADGRPLQPPTGTATGAADAIHARGLSLLVIG